MTQRVVKRMVLMFLGLSIVMLAGYASAEDPTDVTGTWVGTTLRGTATMTMVLKQTGNSVTGTLTGAGTADGPIPGHREWRHDPVSLRRTQTTTLRC